MAEPSRPSAACRLFEHLARDSVVVIVEDLHWAAPLLDCIQYVANFAQNTPMLLVGLERTEFLEVHPDWARSVSGAATILLEPLTGAESGRLIEQLLGVVGIGERVEAQISAEPAATRCSSRSWLRTWSTAGCCATTVTAGWPAPNWTGLASRRPSRCCSACLDGYLPAS